MKSTHVLYCSALGESAWPGLLRRLTEPAGRETAGRTVVVLPSPYLLDKARNMLREADVVAWKPPMVKSMDQLAAMVSESSSRDRTRISRISQTMLLEGLLRRLTKESKLEWAMPIAAEPGFINTLAALFDELKMANTDPEQLSLALEAIAEESPQNVRKHREIALIYRQYQESLQQNRLLDVGEQYLLAMEVLDTGLSSLPFEKVLLAEFSLLSPLRTEFLRRLTRIVSIDAVIQYEKNRPDVFGPVDDTFADLLGMGFVPEFIKGQTKTVATLTAICDGLFRDSVPEPTAGACVKTFIFPDGGTEVRGVADLVKDKLLSGSCRPDEIAVVTRDREYCREIAGVFAERGLPADVEDTVPLANTLAGGMVLAWIKAAESGGARAEVTALLKSAYIVGRLSFDPDRVEALLLDKVIRSWDEWRAAVLALAGKEPAGLEWLEALTILQDWSGRWQQAEGVRAKTGIIRDFLDWADIPEQAGRRYKCKDVGMSWTFLKSELLSEEALRTMLAEIEAYADFLETGPTDDARFSEIFRAALQLQPIPVRARNPAGVQVVTPETASGMKYDTVIVLGCSDGVFPKTQRDSWLLSEKERGLLYEVGVNLSRGNLRNAREDLSFSMAVGMARQEVWLSAVENSETLASPYLTELLRLLEPGSFSLRTYRATDLFPTAASDALDERILRRAKEEAKRASAFNGSIGSGWDSSGRLFSASALETYANCPFLYFVQEVLRLREWDFKQPGLDPMTVGLLWHDTLAAFLSRYRGTLLESAARARYLSELEAALQDRVDGLIAAGKLVLDAWWPVEWKTWIAQLEVWLDRELLRQQRSPAVPSLFEWSFGRNLRQGCDPESVPDALPLQGEGTLFNLQGKVDRIDRLPGGGYRVFDYKTGSVPKMGELSKGRILQVPIYMMAVDRFLCDARQCAEEGVYLPLLKDEKETVVSVATHKAELMETVRNSILLYLTRIEAGLFEPLPAEKCPAYCQAIDWCRVDSEGSADE